MSSLNPGGMPYFRRRENGRYTYWRVLPNDMMVEGSIFLSWRGRSKGDVDLNGQRIIKIALQTNDPSLAAARWAETHSRVEALLRISNAARLVVKEPVNVKKVAALNSDEIAAIAGQAKHDVLSDDDASWIDPGQMTALAAGLQQALANKREGTLPYPALIQFLEQFNINAGAEEINREAQKLDLSNIRSDLALRSTGSLEGSGSLYEVTGAKEEIIASWTGELQQRLHENGIELTNESERRKVGLAILRAKASAFEAVEARSNGSAIETPPRPDLLTKPQTTPSEDPDLYNLHDIWKRLKRPSDKTADDNRLYVDRFVCLNGNLRVSQISRAHVRDFRDLMMQFPRALPASISDLTVREILKWANRQKSVRLLSRRTVNAKALGTISTLLEIAQTEGFIEINPAPKLKLPVKKADQVIREPFDDDDLARLMASPVFAGTAQQSSLRSVGYAVAFWVPLIALYTGARIEEICQLLPSDIKKIGGIDVIQMVVNDSDDPETLSKHLKTDASTRFMPIHSHLVEIGFLNFVKQVANRGDNRLFAHLTEYRGRTAKQASRWWARYQDKHVNDRPEKVFHSFRHTFTDALRVAIVDEPIQKALLGHSEKDVTSGYGKGYPVAVLKSKLEAINYVQLDADCRQRLAKVAASFR